MIKVFLKLAKKYLISLILSDTFKRKLNEKIDIPGISEEKERELIDAVASALSDLI
jgi:hypothetical protein